MRKRTKPLAQSAKGTSAPPPAAKGAKPATTTAASSSSAPSTKDLFKGWTGKTPVALLHEHCRKQGWNQPTFETKHSAKGYYSVVCLSRVDKKTGNVTHLRWRPADHKVYEANNEARHMAATYALHRCANHTPLHRVLPPMHRDYWHQLEQDRTDTIKSKKHMEWLYAADPFAAQSQQQKLAQEQRAKSQLSTPEPARGGSNGGVRRSASPSAASTPKPGKWPVAHMSAANRDRIEGLVRQYAPALAATADSESTHHATQPPVNVAQLTRTLEKLGFRRSHVKEAVAHCHTKQTAIDWLCLHVPETDLPNHFLDSAYRPSVIVHQPTTALTPRDKDIVNRLIAAGFPRHLLMARLVGSEINMAAMAYQLVRELACQSPAVLNSAMDSNCAESLAEERTALESIYGDQFRDLGLGHFAIDVEVSVDLDIRRALAKHGSELTSTDLPASIEVYLPTGLDYPTSSPAFVFYCQLLPAYLCLYVTQRLNEQVDALFAGDLMIFSVVEYAREKVTVWLGTTPSLTELTAMLAVQPHSVQHATVADNDPSTLLTPSSLRPSKSEIMNPTAARLQYAKAYHQAQRTLPFQRLYERRTALPSWQYRAQVLSALSQHQVMIISGATGCGKTTQIPQFILDHYIELLAATNGQPSQNSPSTFGKIICTQPRRLSAIGIAQRVADERCEALGRSVGYAVRGQSSMEPSTWLQFCTTGVLLRMLLSDPSLADVGCVIVDEVHERSVDSDLLLIILRNLLPRRPDLKVILMSATLQSQRFQSYFATSMVIDIPGVTFPVRQIYPEGLFSLAENQSPMDAPEIPLPHEPAHQDNVAGTSAEVLSNRERQKYHPYLVQNLSVGAARALHHLDQSSIRGVIDYAWIGRIVRSLTGPSAPKDTTGAILIFLPGVAEIRQCMDTLQRDIAPALSTKPDIYPLHANLTTQEQARVFAPPTAPGGRKIIVATNVAETSVTIDDVSVVIDAGRVKETRYDADTDMSRLVNTWASQAATRQRQGRAGRTRPGVCYKLFTRHAEQTLLPAYQTPELLRTSLAQLCLQVKALGQVDVAHFLSQALDPPPLASIGTAVQKLEAMSLVTPETSSPLTTLGRHVASLPVDLHIGKMLVFAALFRCVDPILTVAALIATCGSVYSTSHEQRDALQAMRRQSGQTQSDLLTDASIVQGWEQLRSASKHPQSSKAETSLKRNRKIKDYVCTHFLSSRSLHEIVSQKRALFAALKSIGFVPKGVDNWQDTELNTHANQPNVVKAIVMAGLYPNVAHVCLPTQKFECTSAGSVALEAEAKELRYYTANAERAFLHPSSVLFHANKIPSQLVAYFAKFFSSAASKVYLRDVTVMGVYALLFFGGQIRVDHQHQLVHVGPWLCIQAWPRIGVLVELLRRIVEELLQQKIDDPAVDITTHPALPVIVDLLQHDGI
ncbi:helicase [Dimargaris xerosporica]|nr:helicase [Dimargaris xerosporica]